MSLPMYVRSPTGNDAGFLLDSWLKSFRTSWSVKKIPTHLYYVHQRRLVEGLLTSPYSTVLVGCDEESPKVIWGWICAEVVDSALVIHYVYVKELFRSHGLASTLVRMLVEAEQKQGDLRAIMYTHDTKVTNRLIAGLRETGAIPEDMPVVYNPYLLNARLEDDA